MYHFSEDEERSRIRYEQILLVCFEQLCSGVGDGVSGVLVHGSIKGKTSQRMIS